MQDQVAKHVFENSWWNELDQLSRRLNGLAAMCPKVLSQAGTRREPTVKQAKQLCLRFGDG
jgi:hypothetical protein